MSQLHKHFLSCPNRMAETFVLPLWPRTPFPLVFWYRDLTGGLPKKNLKDVIIHSRTSKMPTSRTKVFCHPENPRGARNEARRRTEDKGTRAKDTTSRSTLTKQKARLCQRKLKLASRCRFRLVLSARPSWSDKPKKRSN